MWVELIGTGGLKVIEEDKGVYGWVFAPVASHAETWVEHFSLRSHCTSLMSEIAMANAHVKKENGVKVSFALLRANGQRMEVAILGNYQLEIKQGHVTTVIPPLSPSSYLDGRSDGLHAIHVQSFPFLPDAMVTIRKN